MKTTVRRSATNTAPIHEQVRDALEWLREHSRQASLDALERFAIPSANAFGVPRESIKQLGKLLGTNHSLAIALWDTGVYEARMLVPFIGDPVQLTPQQMDIWCEGMDSWSICDSMCFNFFDKSKDAWSKVDQWSTLPGEFQKRTAFALLWSLAMHEKQAGNEQFLHGLEIIEREAGDERHFVKKAVNMALRSVGKRDNELNTAATKVAQRLARSEDKTARWVGRDALRELTSAATLKRLS